VLYTYGLYRSIGFVSVGFFIAAIVTFLLTSIARPRS
jgi:hypothetical protein